MKAKKYYLDWAINAQDKVFYVVFRRGKKRKQMCACKSKAPARLIAQALNAAAKGGQ